MNLITRNSAQQYWAFLKRFRWQDYGNFALTAYLGKLVVSGEGWLTKGIFLLLLYFSGEKIVKVYRRQDATGLEYYCKKAAKSYSSDDFKKAIHYINKGLAAGSNLKDNPNLYSAYVMRGGSRLMLNKYDEAIMDCTAAIEIDPSKGKGYYARGYAKFRSNSNDEEYEKDIRKAAELGYEDAINMLESISRAKPEISLLNPADNLEEWRISQALLARNAAYIQAYERYIEILDDNKVLQEFQKLKDQLGIEYFTQLEVASKYKDEYMLFRLRNLTTACMAVNMHGQSLEDKDAFGKYFLHPIFDETDTRLRKRLREEDIQKQFDRANELEQYIVYGCSLYCNKLLNLIDGGTREERDKGENYDKFLEIQSSIESKKMVDEIYVVREAMIWTIASTNVDLVTSAEDSDAFEVKAFKLLSSTNKYGIEYGNGPYKRGDIIDAVIQRKEWECQIFEDAKGFSISSYKEKVFSMTDTQLSEEAAGNDSPLEMREFLNRWGQASQIKYGIKELRQAVINDYAYLCHEDGGTKPDETSLQQFKKDVATMSREELLSETSVIETSAFKADELVDYIEVWIDKCEFAELAYEQTNEGGTILLRNSPIKSDLPQNIGYREYFNTALSEWKAGDLRSALSNCNKALEINNSHGQSIRLKGLLHYSLGELKQARKIYLKTIELEETYVEDFFDLGKIENSLGEFEASTTHLLQAIAINMQKRDDSNESFDLAMLAKSSYYLANSFLNLGEYKLGINAYEKCLDMWDWSEEEYSKFNAEFLRLAACLYSGNKDSEKAQEAITRAQSLDPTSAEIWYDSGVIKRESGDLEGAIRDFKKSYEINPSLNSAAHNIGSIYFDLGNNKKACEYWTIGASLGNQNSQALIEKHCSDER
ncbi:tetratricopeptide repeat protein [Synechococcus sp. N5]|uniref:tetratricopeptide repeat protein n=1 Tax=Synechococcus sp. N5 TaxID=2575515 RepID=UPI001FCCB550|nr:tetratricopeptide repeat protein [Synechococcus sp. N5]